MNWKSRLLNAWRWLRALGRNPYFWGGTAVLLFVSAVVYVSFNAYLMPSYTRHDVSVDVPNLENRPFEEAADVVEAYGLQPQRQVGRYNPNVPQDVVVDQNPPPASAVKPGRRIYLTVNSGRVPTVKLPDLSGTSTREAKNRLTALGLEVGDVQADSVPSPYPNTVTRQRPEPGDSLKKGNAVDLWYSEGLGTTYAQVPDLRGLPVDVAKQRLMSRKLRSVVVGARSGRQETSNADSDDVRALEDSSSASVRLFVRDQGRESGARVRVGTEIRLFTTTDSTQARRLRQAMPDTSSDRRNSRTSF